MNGFTRQGHMVYAFNDRDFARYSNVFRTQSLGRKAMNAEIVAQCRAYRPDMVVLSHCKNVENETLINLRADRQGLKIIYTNVDPMNSPQNVRDIRQRCGHVDAMFITTAGKSLRQFSGRHTAVHFFPNPVDRAIDTVCAFDNAAADIDFLFLGRALNHQHDHRRDIADYILTQNMNNAIACHIGGLGVNPNTVYGAAYYDLLARAKMGASISKISDEYLYASDRMSHYLAAGILTFIPQGARFEDILGDGAFVTFSDAADLWGKIQYYAKDNAGRVRIAKNGYDRAHSIFDVDRVCRYMIETVMGESYSAPYEWPTENYGAIIDA